MAIVTSGKNGALIGAKTFFADQLFSRNGLKRVILQSHVNKLRKANR